MRWAISLGLLLLSFLTNTYSRCSSSCSSHTPSEVEDLPGSSCQRQLSKDFISQEEKVWQAITRRKLETSSRYRTCLIFTLPEPQSAWKSGVQWILVALNMDSSSLPPPNVILRISVIIVGFLWNYHKNSLHIMSNMWFQINKTPKIYMPWLKKNFCLEVTYGR